MDLLGAQITIRQGKRPLSKLSTAPQPGALISGTASPATKKAFTPKSVLKDVNDDSAMARRKQYSQHLRRYLNVGKQPSRKESKSLGGKGDIYNQLEISFHTTTEELQATTEELDDLKRSVARYEKEMLYVGKENKMLREELAEKNKIINDNSGVTQEVVVNLETEFQYYKGLLTAKDRKINSLKHSIVKFKEAYEKERSEWEQYKNDLLVAIKVSEELRGKVENSINGQTSDDFFNNRRTSLYQEAVEKALLMSINKVEIPFDCKNFEFGSPCGKPQITTPDITEPTSSEQEIYASYTDSSTEPVEFIKNVKGPSIATINKLDLPRNPRTSFTPTRMAGRNIDKPSEEALWRDVMNKSFVSRRNALLAFCQKVLAIDIAQSELTNFSCSWNNGRAFCLLLYRLSEDKTILPFSLEDLSLQHKPPSNMITLALATCKQIGMSKEMLCEENELSCELPDWKQVIRLVINIIVFIKY
uniref:Calponin-homology (CH) domain-containing protein n=1 Tax=Rhabditophanes sp. KR3021 TaxID=114890 RepID=A0AC35UC40_9BILA